MNHAIKQTPKKKYGLLILLFYFVAKAFLRVSVLTEKLENGESLFDNIPSTYKYCHQTQYQVS